MSILDRDPASPVIAHAGPISKIKSVVKLPALFYEIAIGDGEAEAPLQDVLNGFLLADLLLLQLIIDTFTGSGRLDQLIKLIFCHNLSPYIHRPSFLLPFGSEKRGQSVSDA